MYNNFHYNKNLKDLARKLRNNPTKAENKLWYELLSNGQFGGLKFLRQRPIENYIVDFFCKELMLVIEVDGKTHDFDEVIYYDMKRQERLEKLGLNVIRFSDWEVMYNLGGVQELLFEKVQEIRDKSSPHPPSKGA